MAVETTSAPSLAAADNLTRRLPSFGRVDTSTLPSLQQKRRSRVSRSCGVVRF